MIDVERLMEGAAQYGVQLTREQGEQFDCYAALLVERNQKINLTAIVEPEEILVKHFLDSLTLLSLWSPPALQAHSTRVIDVGTGAGFPGIPLKIACPELDVTLLDSLNKRILFLEAVSQALGLSVHCVHSRAEDGGHNPLYREQFDLATARAVANLRELAEYCLPFVKKGGVFLAMKGWEVEEEAEGASRAIQLLGGRISTVEKLRLPLDCGRALVKVEKISQTPAKFPRIPAKIAKNPLI